MPNSHLSYCLLTFFCKTEEPHEGECLMNILAKVFFLVQSISSFVIYKKGNFGFYVFVLMSMTSLALQISVSCLLAVDFHRFNACNLF